MRLLGIRNTAAWTIGATLAVAAAITLTVALTPAGAEAPSLGSLCVYGSDGSADTGATMQPGTSPAITGLSGGGAEVAFQTSSGDLGTYDDVDRSVATTSYAMDPASSPAISQRDGTVAVAMASNTDQLMTGDGTSESGASVVLASGTSPSVAVLSSSDIDYAYQGTNTSLYEGGNGNYTYEQVGEASGASPAITAVPTSSGEEWETAQQVNTGALWEVGQASDDNTGQGMATHTNPAITGLASPGDFEIAFQANNNDLYIWGSDGNANTGSGMAAGTSPSITHLGTAGDYEIAYQGANGDLWVYGSEGTIDTGHQMASGTSPSIAATSAGYEVAYQCAAPAPPVTTTVVRTITVQATTPSPTAAGHRRLQAQFLVHFDWDGTATRQISIRSIKRLPRGATVRIGCAAAKTSPHCPRLAPFPTRGRTLSRELAVVSGLTFGRGDVLILSVSADRYLTEVFRIGLIGRNPTITRTWRR